jgi:uncharacterized repeat protein (TIGR01451 family)
VTARGRTVAAALLAALVLGAAASARAQIGRGDLVITVSESLDPVPSGGEIAYGIAIKNTGSIRARDVVVTIPLPSGTTFGKCTTTPTALVPCAASGVTVTTTFQYIRAHATAKIRLTLKMPSVTAQTVVSLFIDANGDRVNDATLTVTTTVLASAAVATYLPSGRQVILPCGSELDAAAFGTDTTLRLDASLGCSATAVGLRIAASGKTLDLNKFKIIGPNSGAVAKGSAGIVIAAGRTNVTVSGGSTNGTAGIEFFDWCIADEGGNTGLAIDKVRCFRARSAGFDLVSDNVSVTSALVDKAVGTKATTFEPPGGVGIRVTGDNVSIHNTKVRRSAVGVWASGADADANGNVVTITGNTSSSRVESSIGIGILADGEKLQVKDMLIMGDGLDGKSTDGVVLAATAVGAVLDGVQVKKFAGSGIVAAGAATQILRSRVEQVGADAYVVTGAGSTLANNEARAERHGYVLGAADLTARTNLAEDVGGDGFVVDGERAKLDGNAAKSTAGHGFVLNGAQAIVDTNTAEFAGGDGFQIAGGAGAYGSNRAKSGAGIGYAVTGLGNLFTQNVAELNDGLEWTIAPDNVDGGGNKANGGACTAFGPAGGTC